MYNASVFFVFFPVVALNVFPFICVILNPIQQSLIIVDKTLVIYIEGHRHRMLNIVDEKCLCVMRINYLN